MRLNVSKLLDKVGAAGSFLAAAACPACFPLLAAAGAALGLGVLHPFEGYMVNVMQGFVGLALVGNILAWRRHRNPGPLVLGTASPALVFFSIHVVFNPTLIYVGLASAV